MTIITKIVGFVVGVVVMAIHPQRMECPSGFLGNGVRRNGDFACIAPIAEKCCGEPKGPCELECPDEVVLSRHRIHCTGGTEPIIVNAKIVGCQRGGWR